MTKWEVEADTEYRNKEDEEVKKWNEEQKWEKTFLLFPTIVGGQLKWLCYVECRQQKVYDHRWKQRGGSFFNPPGGGWQVGYFTETEYRLCK